MTMQIFSFYVYWSQGISLPAELQVSGSALIKHIFATFILSWRWQGHLTILMEVVGSCEVVQSSSWR